MRNENATRRSKCSCPMRRSKNCAHCLKKSSGSRRNVKHAETSSGGRIDAVRPRHRESALNLVHYTELRRHDIRDLQSRLSKYGLSSLGRTESHVLPSIDTLIWTLTGW